MENAADALKIAASVLIFVVALSISINAFGEASKYQCLWRSKDDCNYNIKLSR